MHELHFVLITSTNYGRPM